MGWFVRAGCFLGSPLLTSFTDGTQRPTFSMFDFAHWLEHQWVPYAGESSPLASDIKQTYVIRYEDLQRDPLHTTVQFLETTVRPRPLCLRIPFR